ncbi:MAG: class D sortase [Anaerolineales bacterium]|nr:class D sortase [Anaerolineales bacterium]
MDDRRTGEELSIVELKALLKRKKLEAQRERLLHFEKQGRIVHNDCSRPGWRSSGVTPERDQLQSYPATAPADSSRLRHTAGRILSLLEISAVLFFVFIFISGMVSFRKLNSISLTNFSALSASPTPLIRAVVLPSGHTPPTSPGGARFNEEEIPQHLRPVAQSYASVAIPTPGPEQARSIFIPALWDVPAPVVQGDGWEQLKRGVAQHLGTANPGERGNLVLSAHNDIYGELFRDLDQLQPGDEIRVYTVSGEYLYRVTGTLIIEPTEVSVMDPTEKPTITLISCYPYLVDTERIIITGDLT